MTVIGIGGPIESCVNMNLYYNSVHLQDALEKYAV